MGTYLENITNNFNLLENELSKSKCLDDFSNELEVLYRSAVEGIVEEESSRSKLETLVLHSRVYNFFELIDEYDPLVRKSRELNYLSQNITISENEKYLSINRLFDVLIYFSMDITSIKDPTLGKKLNSESIEKLSNMRKAFLKKYLI